MNTQSILATLCSILLIYAPLAEASGSQPLGTLSSDGATQVNGIVTTTGATIFAGDRVVSPEGVSTALSMKGGSRLILAGPGALQMKETLGQPTAKLEDGSLAVLSRASAPIAVEAAGTRITGGPGGAVYAVTANGNNLQVGASKGEASVEGADRTINVSEGKTLVATMVPPNLSDQRKPPPPAASGGYAARFFTFDRVLLIATAAAAGAALGIAIKDLVRSCRVTGSPATVSCD